RQSNKTKKITNQKTKIGICLKWKGTGKVMFGMELLASATSDRRQLSGGTHPPYLTSPLLEFLKGGEEIRCSSRRSPNVIPPARGRSMKGLGGATPPPNFDGNSIYT
ncbi:hypothetical protein AABB24_012632, partial [Solanum stoloniferum]